MENIKIFILFLVTAITEIVACYLPWLVLKQGKSPWLLIPSAILLIIFAWLLTIHPNATGRIYAAYGGVYIAVALIWLAIVDKAPITKLDLIGSVFLFIGVFIIFFQPTKN